MNDKLVASEKALQSKVGSLSWATRAGANALTRCVLQCADQEERIKDLTAQLAEARRKGH